MCLDTSFTLRMLTSHLDTVIFMSCRSGQSPVKNYLSILYAFALIWLSCWGRWANGKIDWRLQSKPATTLFIWHPFSRWESRIQATRLPTSTRWILRWAKALLLSSWPNLWTSCKTSGRCSLFTTLFGITQQEIRNGFEWVSIFILIHTL